MDDDQGILTDAKYTAKLQEVREALDCRPICSQEGMRTVFRTFFGKDPHDFQVDCVQSLVGDSSSKPRRPPRDVFLTSKTGSGKSLVLYGAVVANRLLAQKHLTLACYPTLALMEDQECSARRHGIRMLAMTGESILEANQRGRSLWNDAEAGDWDILAFSPEMLQTDGFAQLLDRRVRDVGVFAIDEAHMIRTWGTEFRVAFVQINRMRHRLPSSVAWLGMSGSVRDVDRVSLQEAMGFNVHSLDDYKLPTDRPELFIRARFLRHSTSGFTFPDLAWAVQPSATEREHLEPVLFAVETRTKGEKLLDWLDRELRKSMTDIVDVVVLFSAVTDPPDRRRIMENVQAGRTRYVVATMAANVGLDFSGIRGVVLVDLVDSIETILQWMGRAGRDGLEGWVLIYAPEKWRTLDGRDRGKLYNQKALTKTQLEQREEFQRTANRDILRLLNPREGECRRSEMNCPFGGLIRGPQESGRCCDWHTCQWQLYQDELGMVDAYASRAEKAKKVSALPLLGQDEYNLPKLETEEVDLALQYLTSWRFSIWRQMRDGERHVITPGIMIPDAELKSLISKVHQTGSSERLGRVVQALGWNQHANISACDIQALWGVVEELRHRIQELREDVETEIVTKRKNRKAAITRKTVRKNKKNDKDTSDEEDPDFEKMLQHEPAEAGKSSNLRRSTRDRKLTSAVVYMDLGED